MRCEAIDCGATAVATVIQTRGCARPGEEHHACSYHAHDSRFRGLDVVEMHDDSVPWSEDDRGPAK